MTQSERTAPRTGDPSNTGVDGLPYGVTRACAVAVATDGEQRHAAAELGVHRSILCRWLSGERRLPADALPRLLTYLSPSSRRRVLSALLPEGMEVAAVDATHGSFWGDRLRLLQAEGAFAGELLAALEDGAITPEEAGPLLDAARDCVDAWQSIASGLEALERRQRGAIKGVMG